MSSQHFYITTPLYYVNAQPHLGTLYSTLLADVAARWQRFCGNSVFFLTGTDEHGQKIAERAAQDGRNPQEFVDQMIPLFKRVWDHFDISYDHFIRTTDAHHAETVTRWIHQLLENGDIYKDTYEGLYCTPCETFVTATQTEGEQCPTCNRPVEKIMEENYFFRLSKYQDQLLAFYAAHPDFIQPKDRLNEVISFVQSGLRDLSISRRSVSWGIPFPGDSEHVVYVWGDALMNYVSALGYLQEDCEKFNDFWPANVQVMAKDIVKFHAVYFPAFLMAAGIEPAKKLLVHGYILVNNDKMSKSKGNAFDPLWLAEAFGVDQVRYYLTRHMVTTDDCNFTVDDMAQRIASDLANGIGNLLQRTTSLAHKYDVIDIAEAPSWSKKSQQLQQKCGEMLEIFEREMNATSYHTAYRAVWEYIAAVNGYFHDLEPWKLAQKDFSAFLECIAAATQSLYILAHVLLPVMPKKAAELLRALGHDMPAQKESVWLVSFDVSCTLTVPEQPLFIRPELPKQEAPMTELAQKTETTPAVETKTAPTNYIGIEDLMKVELIVGTILECEPIEKSDKLYCMKIDLGSYGVRQILAGIRKFLSQEQLIGQKGVFVANLPPRKMMGHESQGMMLFAKDEQGNHSITTVNGDIANGTRLS